MLRRLGNNTRTKTSGGPQSPRSGLPVRDQAMTTTWVCASRAASARAPTAVAARAYTVCGNRPENKSSDPGEMVLPQGSPLARYFGFQGTCTPRPDAEAAVATRRPLVNIALSRNQNDLGAERPRARASGGSTISIRTPVRVFHHWSGSKPEWREG
jgi:hypothetical protein